MDLNYPIQPPFNNLKSEIENWLWNNNYTFGSVTFTQDHGEYILTITQSSIPFNKIRQTNDIAGGFGVETYFNKSNCDGPVTPPKTICELCREAGYDCERCPYWELDEPCNTCTELGISDCNNCEYAVDICTRCTNLGYADCTSCPLSVAKIKPLKIEVEYNHTELTTANTTPVLVRVTDRSFAYRHDGTTRLRESQNMAKVGTAGTLTGLGTTVYPNIMEISLEDEWINLGTYTSVVTIAESALITELNNAGITDPAIQASFVEAVMTEVAAAWGGRQILKYHLVVIPTTLICFQWNCITMKVTRW